PLAIGRARHLSRYEAVPRHPLLLPIALRCAAARPLSARTTRHRRTRHGAGHLPRRMRAYDANIRDRRIPADRLRAKARRDRRVNDRLAR
ncbi:hypothetical protein ACSTLM_01025, partial [Vibrio parahaemolyticus]